MRWRISFSSPILIPVKARRAKSLILLSFCFIASTVFAREGEARTCEVAFHLDDDVTLTAIQMTIDYSMAQGVWKLGTAGMHCVTDAGNALALFADKPALEAVESSFISLAGIDGPKKLAHCYFIETPGQTLEAGDFVTYISEATRLNGTTARSPKISVKLPNCAPVAPTTTTTTSSTTTTQAPDTTTTLETTTTTDTTTTSTTSTTSTTLLDCGNGVVDDTEDCDDGNVEDGDGCDADCTTDVVCGDVNGNHSVQTSDALTVLRAAIGQPVDCPAVRCDADGDSKVRASDSLRVLKRAVGQSIVMSCPVAEQ